MHNNKSIGNRGEAIAANYLSKRGYEILARQKRLGRAEVDLIARFGSDIIFIEVKTSNSKKHGFAEASVSDKKRILLCEAAQLYSESQQLTSDIQFDVIAVTLTPDESEVLHLKDLLFPFDGMLGSTDILP